MPDSLDLLEWPALFEALLDQCQTPYGVRAWEDAPFLEDGQFMAVHQAETEGLKVLIQRYGDVTSETAMPDITSVVQRLAKEALLNLQEVRHIIRVLNQGGRLLRHFARNLKSETSFEQLAPMLDEELIPEAVQEFLSRYLDEEGDFKDSASPKLAGLRQKLRSQQHAIRQKVQQYLTGSETAQALQSHTVTEREGRMVFPVKVEHKAKLPGVIHGASSSGATVFVEPEGLIGLNNELQALQADMQKEIDRLLKEISQALHGHWETLAQFINALGYLDRRLAAARFSLLLNANPVEICTESQVIDLKKARHPLLVLQMRKQPLKGDVVANDFRLGLDGIRTLVITGPNTGGKTVLLKTVGLFALMLRAGLHLPVGEHSRMAHFHSVLADIGDQQSIAQSLSTFSAHIERLKSFVADETDLSCALVLIDEIAAGTDPAEGAALAKAILDELYAKGALTIVTTHLGELKLDAHQHEGFMNASVEFDAETLSPTYRLMLGVPGASNAITIAQRLGLKPSVIDRARASLSAPVRESASLLQEFELKNKQLGDELETARSYRIAAQEAYEKLEFERQKLETDKRQALKQFQLSLKSRIHGLEEQVKHVKKELQQENVKNVDRLARKLKSAGQKADEVFYESRESIGETARLKLGDLKTGETVFSRQLEVTGEITALLPESDEVVLQAGIMRVTVPVSDLQRPYQPRSGTAKKTAKAKSLDRPIKAMEGASVLEEPRDPSLTCDVRGQRVDEAIQAVEQFLDEAVVSGYQSVAIVHGMGTGALKKEIRSYLSGSAYVKRFYPAQATQGGDGKTIVELAG